MRCECGRLDACLRFLEGVAEDLGYRVRYVVGEPMSWSIDPARRVIYVELSLTAADLARATGSLCARLARLR